MSPPSREAALRRSIDIRNSWILRAAWVALIDAGWRRANWEQDTASSTVRKRNDEGIASPSGVPCRLSAKEMDRTDRKMERSRW